MCFCRHVLLLSATGSPYRQALMQPSHERCPRSMTGARAADSVWSNGFSSARRPSGSQQSPDDLVFELGYNIRVLVDLDAALWLGFPQFSQSFTSQAVVFA